MEKFDKLVEIIKMLRSPTGCPWDREQNLYSLKEKFLEEAYEVVDALDRKDTVNIQEELGDILLHVVMHSVIAEEEKIFSLDDVLDGICAKMIRRHPHVFADENLADTASVMKRWEEIKKEEKKNDKNDNKSILDKAMSSMPSINRSEKLQKIATKAGFDWENITDRIAKLDEEVDELKSAIKNSDHENIKEELGDLMFVIVNIANSFKISTDEALRFANIKFYKRFNYIEEHVRSIGKTFDDLSLAELETIYLEGKSKLD